MKTIMLLWALNADATGSSAMLVAKFTDQEVCVRVAKVMNAEMKKDKVSAHLDCHSAEDAVRAMTDNP